MQQTEKYKFSLIEMSDTFGPEALNQNAENIEKELARVEDAQAADKAELKADAAALLAAMGTLGRTCRIQWGEYTGTGQSGKSHPNSLSFEICPVMVYIQRSGSGTHATYLRLNDRGYESSGGANYLTWEGHSLSWYSTSASGAVTNQMNTADAVYRWVALGYDDSAEQ